MYVRGVAWRRAVVVENKCSYINRRQWNPPEQEEKEKRDEAAAP